MAYKNKEDKNRWERNKRKREYKMKRAYIHGVLGGRCIECFSNENLEIHHRIQIFRNRDKRTRSNIDIVMIDFRKNQNSLILLCAACHIEKHRGE